MIVEQLSQSVNLLKSSRLEYSITTNWVTGSPSILSRLQACGIDLAANICVGRCWEFPFRQEGPKGDIFPIPGLHKTPAGALPEEIMTSKTFFSGGGQHAVIVLQNMTKSSLEKILICLKDKNIIMTAAQYSITMLKKNHIAKLLTDEELNY